MSMVHDNIITSYIVDFENEQLVMKTVYYHNGVISENTDVIFKSYFTHMFNNEFKGSIIFDIEECSLNHFIENERELIEDNRNYCWPIVYKTDNATLELSEFIQKNGYKIFDINSSYGLYGWVISKEVEIIVTEVAK